MRTLGLTLLFLAAALFLLPTAVAAAPTITAADITTADGSYMAGDTITIQTTYSEAVTVNTGGGTPILALNFNGQNAAYSSGTGTATLTWTYTIQAGDTSADAGASGTGAISLNGGTIRNVGAEDAVNTLPDDLTAGSAVVVDTTAPSADSIVRAGADPTNAASIDFTVTFSEHVNGIAVGDFTLTGSGDAAGNVASVSAASATSVTVTVNSVSGDGTLRLDFTGTVTDDAGNDDTGSFAAGDAYTIDNTSPTVTVEQKAGQADPTSAAPILFTATFSEDVTGFAPGDVTVAGTSGGGTASVSGGPAVYEISVSAIAGDGTVTASIGAGLASDAAGNTNAASTSADNEVTYDTTAPSVTVEQKAGQADPASTGPILFTATFSETVTGFTADDVTVGGTSVGGTASVSGGPAVYEISIDGMTSDGTVTASIAAGVASDTTGNTNSASTSADNEVTYDTPTRRGGGGGIPSTGSHGFITGFVGGSSFLQDTQHTVIFWRGAVATIDVTIDGEDSVKFSIVTRDQEADDLPDGFRSTSIWFDITLSSASEVVTATVTMRPLDPSLLDGEWQDLTAFHQTESGWMELPTTVEQSADGTVAVSFTVDSFSSFVLAFDETPEPTPTSSTTTSTTAPAKAGSTGSTTSSPTDDPSNQSPALLWAPILGVLAVAVVLRRRL